jgi:hypothetical protein
MRTRAGRASPELIRAYLGVSYLGLAYLVAAVAGGPNTTRFWIILVVSLASFAPVWLLGLRLTDVGQRAGMSPEPDRICAQLQSMDQRHQGDAPVKHCSLGARGRLVPPVHETPAPLR